MPKNITQYDLLISCPGDITDEIGIVEEVVAKLFLGKLVKNSYTMLVLLQEIK